MKHILAISLLMNFSFCCSQNYSDYIDLDKIEAISDRNNLLIIPVTSYYITYKEKEKPLFIIDNKGEMLYKLDSKGNYIDSLNIPIGSDKYFKPIYSNYSINKDNGILFTEHGYFPNWLENGDQTFKKYDKSINEDLKMDSLTIKKSREEDLKFEYKTTKNDVKEYYAFLDSKIDNFELIRLAKKLFTTSQYVIAGHGIKGHYYIFSTSEGLIKVNFPSELDYYMEKAIPNQEDMNYYGNNNKYAIQRMMTPLYSKEIKRNHFKKKERVAGYFNILSTNSHGPYWFGEAYYKLPLGRDYLKVKQSSDNYSKNKIKIGTIKMPNKTEEESNIYFVDAGRKNYIIIRK